MRHTSQRSVPSCYSENVGEGLDPPASLQVCESWLCLRRVTFLFRQESHQRSRLKRGERCERRQWRMKRAERVAAVGEMRRLLQQVMHLPGTATGTNLSGGCASICPYEKALPNTPVVVRLPPAGVDWKIRCAEHHPPLRISPVEKDRTVRNQGNPYG